MDTTVSSPFVAIACGGTGGHLFPGIAIAEELKKHDCIVTLLISPKDVDQQAVKSAQGMEVVTLPAVGLQNRNYFSFARSFWRSYCAARDVFRRRRPDAVLAMGGFTSAPPVLASKRFDAKTFLHESNTIPGKANRFLGRFVDEAFVGFPEAASRLRARQATVTGTPVRSQFFPEANRQAADARIRLGLDPNLPTVLVVGGSQGASGLNGLVLSALASLKGRDWQWLHLTGQNDFEKVQAAYAAQNIKAVVKPFLGEMDLALAAATAGISRSGASSLAEMAATRLPSILVPLPTSADDHQRFNAAAFEKTGAARLLEQNSTTPEKTAGLLTDLMENGSARSSIQNALDQWYQPRAAQRIAERILESIARSRTKAAACSCGHAHGRTRPAAG